MSETIYVDIRAALMTRLLAMNGVPTVLSENEDTDPVIETAYLKTDILWAEETQAELGDAGRNWERGVFQVDVQYPPGIGVGDMNLMLGKLREWFRRGTTMIYNGVTVKVRKASLGPLSTSATGVKQPISIAFYCQAAN